MFREFMIKDIVRMIDGKTKIGDLELVRGISINSKTTKPGDLFFALKGEHTDGHLYTSEALKNGAVGVVVKEGTNNKSEIVVSDTLFALGKLAQGYRNLFQPRTIGITGTNGKTTVKNLISGILSKKYRVLSTTKNYNSLIGLPLTVFELSGQEDYLVLEMGTSNPGEIKRLCEIANPIIGVITNIGPGHLMGLGSIEGIKQEKLSLIDWLPEEGFGLIGDGVGDVKKHNVLRFSLDMLENIQLSEYGSRFRYKGNEFFTLLLGLGNIYNCLAAICLTSEIGVEYELQRDAIAEVKPEPGRLEPIHHDNLLIINDTYNANPVSMKVSIDFISNLDRRKICILGDMRELGGQSKILHNEVGKYAKENCDSLLSYGDEARFFEGKHFTDKNKLFKHLRMNLSGDEVILVKASRALHFETIIDDLLRLL